VETADVVSGILFGPWMMVLLAAAVLSGLAVGLPLALMKMFGLFALVTGNAGEWLRAERHRVRIGRNTREATGRAAPGSPSDG
jgi:hypothetical protein